VRRTRESLRVTDCISCLYCCWFGDPSTGAFASRAHVRETFGVAPNEGAQVPGLERTSSREDLVAKRASLAEFEFRLLSAVLAGHPYRDAILGDLSEERLKIEAAAGAGEARRWYRGQVRRSVWSMLSSYWIAPGLALGLMALVGAVYLAAIRTASIAGLKIEHVLGQSRGRAFVALYLVAIGIAGGVGGFVVSVAARRHAFAAALFMLAVTIAVGVVHVETGPPHESWFRFWKVLVFVLTVTIGLFFGTQAASTPDREH